MDDPTTERENLRLDLALLSRMRANLQPGSIADQACNEVMRERIARLEELECGEHGA